MDVVSRILKLPKSRMKFTSAGINHFFTLLSVQDRKTGEELLDKARKKVLSKREDWMPPLWLKLMELFGIFSYPSDDHIGEYLGYGASFTGIKWHYGQEDRQVHLVDEPEGEPLADFFKPISAGLRKFMTHAGDELTVPIICDMELNRGNWREAVNVLNTGEYISNLPASAAVEIPAMPDASGLHPQHVGAIPESLAAYTRIQISIHEAITAAWRTRSKELLLQALLFDPVINDWKAAEKMLGDMLELQREFLPKFK
jgi:alpha-galactosidase